MPYTRRVGFGMDRTLTGWARVRANYSHQIGRNLFRSRDLNAPIDGVRPDSAIRNLTLLESSAHSLNRSLEVNVMLNHRPRRFTANIGYTLGEALNESDGALSLPPDSFDLSNEWGPSRQDVRHRLSASMNTDLKAGFRMNIFLRAQSASPYNITTGLDENRDGQTNERPYRLCPQQRPRRADHQRRSGPGVGALSWQPRAGQRAAGRWRRRWGRWSWRR